MRRSESSGEAGEKSLRTAVKTIEIPIIVIVKGVFNSSSQHFGKFPADAGFNAVLSDVYLTDFRQPVGGIKTRGELCRRPNVITLQSAVYSFHKAQINTGGEGVDLLFVVCIVIQNGEVGRFCTEEDVLVDFGVQPAVIEIC